MSLRRDLGIAALLSIPFDLHAVYHAIDYTTNWKARDFFGPLSVIFDPRQFYIESIFPLLTFGMIHAMLDAFAYAPMVWLGYCLWRSLPVRAKAA